MARGRALILWYRFLLWAERQLCQTSDTGGSAFSLRPQADQRGWAAHPRWSASMPSHRVASSVKTASAYASPPRSFRAQWCAAPLNCTMVSVDTLSWHWVRSSSAEQTE